LSWRVLGGLVLGVVAMALVLWPPAAARADWSAPRAVASAPPIAEQGAYLAALGGGFAAVDSRGDVAVVWSRTGRRPARAEGRQCSWGEKGPPKRLGCYPVTQVHLSVYLASGHVSTRLVTSRRGVAPVGLVATPTEATILLTYADPSGASDGSVGAAYGPLVHGRWPAPRLLAGRWRIGWINGFAFNQPRIALARDGTVLAVWEGCRSARACAGVLGDGGAYAREHVVAAWRSPSHPFGSAKAVAAAPPLSAPQFDADGTAYLTSECSGTVAIAPAHSHGFRRVVLTDGPAQSFRLALSGAGEGAASWIAGACSYDEASGDTSGPLFVGVLRAGAFMTPVALAAAPAAVESANAVAAPPGVVITWNVILPSALAQFLVGVNGVGMLGTIEADPAALPIAADGGGDVLYQPQGATGSAPGAFVQPAGTGADEPAPVSSSARAAAAGAGRGFALTWIAHDSTLELSIWRPGGAAGQV
jgi:hypothetical protein